MIVKIDNDTYEPVNSILNKSFVKETILEPKRAATIPKSKINEIALGIFAFWTNSVAANRYCRIKETDIPISKFAKQ